MEHQPTITFEPYYKAGAIESRSYLLKSEQPDDFFKNYVDPLSAVHGKWNYSLGGWIFPSKYQNEVRQVIEQITSGQIPPKEYAYQKREPIGHPPPAIGQLPNQLIPSIGQTVNVLVNGVVVPAAIKSLVVQGTVSFSDGSVHEIQAVNGPLQIKGYTLEHKIVP